MIEGEILHRDSLGTTQPIRPGAVNWMTAGRGITHSERSDPALRLAPQRMFGIQSWVALPASHEEAPPAFAHHAAESLPVAEEGGSRARLVAGEAWGMRAPVQTHSPLFYADLSLAPGGHWPMPDTHEERAAYVVQGEVQVAGQGFEEGQMLVFRAGDAITLRGGPAGARLLLLGGAVMDGPRHIFWNFVSSRRDRIEAAKADWQAGRFARVPGDEEEFIPLPRMSARG